MALPSALRHTPAPEAWTVLHKASIATPSTIIVATRSPPSLHICLRPCRTGGNIPTDLARFFLPCTVEIYRRIGIFVLVDRKLEVNKQVWRP